MHGVIYNGDEAIEFRPAGQTTSPPVEKTTPTLQLEAKQVYKKLMLLQMIRHRRISTLGRANIIHPIALALFTSAAVVFGPITICSSSAISVRKEHEQATSVAQIRSVLRAQQEAWNQGDIDGFMNGYARSGSTTFVSEDAVRRGWENVRERYLKKYSDRGKMGLLTFSDLEITLVSVDAAVVLGHWKLKRTQDRPHGRFTLIFRKTADGWRIVHDHTSAAAPRSNSLK
jgi:ketosteroid isomerase-like protein